MFNTIAMADWITFGLSLLGMIITGIFSFFVWKVSKNTFLLSLNIQKMQEEQDERNKDEYKDSILQKAYDLNDIISKQAQEINVKLLFEAPVSHGLSEIVLAKYFSNKQRRAVKDIWSVYEYYIKLYWKNPDGSDVILDGPTIKGIKEESKKASKSISEFIKIIETN